MAPDCHDSPDNGNEQKYLGTSYNTEVLFIFESGRASLP
jgi:hypothetical protein